MEATGNLTWLIVEYVLLQLENVQNSLNGLHRIVPDKGRKMCVHPDVFDSKWS